ncbi:hypothetical protein J4480_04955 [Candidatus Woesearchaeota archaeon]|nr:hypothetical protein [Candidatus Woesearchaeota archaeon]
MKIYLVGDRGAEHNSVYSTHRTYDGALKAWNKLRLELLKSAKSHLKNNKTTDKEMWQRIISNLSCEDPKKIDNYPHETPYIRDCTLIH